MATTIGSLVLLLCVGRYGNYYRFIGTAAMCRAVWQLLSVHWYCCSENKFYLIVHGRKMCMQLSVLLISETGINCGMENQNVLSHDQLGFEVQRSAEEGRGD